MTIRPSEYVRSRLCETLTEGAASDAVDLLAASRFPLVEPGSTLEERIHLGILKLVCGPWGRVDSVPDAATRFSTALELAKVDWRDLLVSAGLQHDDWPEVLTAAGYQAPRKH